MSDDNPLMPIMGKRYGVKVGAGVPMAMLDEAQAGKNHGQSLDTLRRRGGLSAFEALCNLDGIGLWDREPRSYEEEEAELAERVQKWRLACGGATSNSGPAPSATAGGSIC